MKRAEAVRHIAQRAMRGYDDLNAVERARLLRALAVVLPKKEAEAARATAWTIRAAEAQQLKFAALLTPRPKA